MAPLRRWGLVFCGLGLLGFLAGVALPVYEAYTRAERISYYMSACVVTPLLIGLGLVHAIGGAWAKERFGDPYQPTKAGGMLVIMLLAAGFVFHLYIVDHLRALGYQF
jgi:hypothetical protein